MAGFFGLPGAAADAAERPWKSERDFKPGNSSGGAFFFLSDTMMAVPLYAGPAWTDRVDARALGVHGPSCALASIGNGRLRNVSRARER